MAILTDDQDIRQVHMFTELGGNGDYYIVLIDMDEIKRLDMRISTSGGNAPHEVKMAVSALYRAMEKHGLNKHPKDDE